VVVLCGAAIATVFTVAVAGKLTKPGFVEFRGTIGRLWYGPGRLSRAAQHAVAVQVVTLELVAVVGIVAGGMLELVEPGGRWTVPGLAVAVALLAIFVMAHAVAAARRREVVCACFGRTSVAIGPLTLLRAGLLFGMALTGLVAAARGWRGSPAISALIEIPAGTVLGLILVNVESLVALWRPVDGSGSDVRGGSPAEVRR
jgi:hypothetical protein